ncbi:MAG: acetyltransferase [Myxococcales bacterium]|nr:acetyltransferase [Myxococcales bacterium]MCB9546973.1 acetyltransferase [Myxococcales bacterium]
MTRRALRRAALGALLPLALSGCFEAVELVQDVDKGEVQTGEAREVELRMLRLDVKDYRQTLSLADLKRLPKATLEELWLLDLEMLPLVTNTLLYLRDANPAELGSQAAINMQTLLKMSPDEIDFSATQLEELLALSGAIGAPPARAIADLMQIHRAEVVIPLDVAAQVLTIGLIGSHPSGQVRRGAVTPDHPDGLYDVTPGTIPVTLADVVEEFASLQQKFGPVDLPDGTRHPGFIEEASGFAVIEDQFAMTVKVDANALPYKGIDLTDGSGANVNSIGVQIEQIFDTSDPEWMQVEGLVPEPGIGRLTVRVAENPAFIPSGTRKDPVPHGDSPVWDLPPWEFERLVARMAEITTFQKRLPNCVEYTVGAGTVVFQGCVDDAGWTTFETFNNAGNPPEPAYMADVMLNMAQVRLHDGGLAEGEASVAFTVRDAVVGLGSADMVERIKINMAQNPKALRELAALTKETTLGAADFFYVRGRETAPPAEQGDWLFFIAPSDIPRQPDGSYARPYAYPAPGFFADEALTQPVAVTTAVDGDTDHLKVQVNPGDTLYVADDEGRVFRLDVGAKPSRARLKLGIRRLR